MRLDDVDAFAVAHAVRAGDHVRQVDGVGGQVAQGGGQPGALGGMGCVLVDRLVGRGGNIGAGVHVTKDRLADATNCWLIRQDLAIRLVESDNMRGTGVGLGQLVLALDATLVRLVEAPRGLDVPVRSAALIDSDDVRLGLSVSAGSADVFFLLGVGEADATRWIERQTAAHGAPAAIFVKEPSDAVVDRAVSVGTAVVAVDPKARWERLYRLVNHVFENRRADPLSESGTDLFALAQSIADRTHGMVSIEDAQSHVLAYSASNDEADELRRLSILGRAGPAEHLQWIAQWGIFDILRAGSEVVRVDERPALGLRPRLAIGIHRPDAPAHISWAPSGCSRAHARWPTTPRTCCAVRRCWPRGSWPAWRRGRRRICSPCSRCWGWPTPTGWTSPFSPANSVSPPTAARP